MMSNNFCIIMAGGAGTRFWPCSRTEKPKQFLDFFGTGRTLLQTTYDRMKKIVPAENIYIASNKNYKELILEQLPELGGESHLLLEPARRNTAPCIAYSMNKIASIDPDANVIITPSDHLILKEDEFAKTVNKALNFAESNDSLLTLGIKPSRPETGYGYIQIDGEAKTNEVTPVKTFTEKPNIDLAKMFFESGEFLWNSGMFIWNIKSIKKVFEAHESELWSKFSNGAKYYNTNEEQSYVDSVYGTCKNLSIDYAILEKATNVSVIAADFGWSDLGTWGSLYELKDKDENKNATLKGNVIYHNSKNNVVSLGEGKVAVIEGMDDCVIVDDGDVLLICKKSQEQHIREYSSEVGAAFSEKYL